MTEYRVESDSMGQVEVPADALYGAQTQRAVDNFPVSGRPMPETFVRALLLIKCAAASANVELDLVSPAAGEAIVAATERLLADPRLMTHFPVDIFQTGSGTSSNMNANEVVATIAGEICGEPVSANDHVNFGQSSNDVIPTAIHVSAALAIDRELLPALQHLIETIRTKAQAVGSHVKTGRTHLMDAMPVTLSQTLSAWADQVEEGAARVRSLQGDLQALAQGGTAVGTGINAHPQFSEVFCEKLNNLTGMAFTPAPNAFTRIGSQDTAVAVSGALKSLAVALIKISNDLRWMNSGPLAGLGEIELEALQPGSSIMPGKVNPVIPEAAAMVGAQVIGNDAAITLAGQSGNFELNVMLPLVASNLLDSIGLLASASELLADRAIASFSVREDKLASALTRNPILVTALNPVIGYLEAARIAKLAYASGRPIIDVAEEETDLGRAELERLLDPESLTRGGLQT